MSDYFPWRPYVPVAARRARAVREAARLAKKGHRVAPIRIEGRVIASTFWGRGWCDQMERFGDFANRLPRGRTYVRNGSVIDLGIEAGRVRALVMGSELYRVSVAIRTLPRPRWKAIVGRCAGKIDSLVSLLRGRLSPAVMQVIADPQGGLFPRRPEIEFECSCPDWAVMCKHVAAVLYGVGARLDREPELLFVLRQVDQMDLIGAAPAIGVGAGARAPRPAAAPLGEVFGIEIDEGEPAASGPASEPRPELPPEPRTGPRPRRSGPVVKDAPVRLRMTDRMRGARRLQGRYLGLLRKLAGDDRAAVKQAAAREGVAQAVRLAERIVGAKRSR